mmetsp:Transcript_16044/g.27659  ORF Transcript_16044/g.27659 Transcript_16044/m.27659 type:complete len:164 (+) Transcript_16044:33-524(+)
MSNDSLESLFGYKVLDLSKREFDLSQLKGKVVLIVNVASQCGLTDSNYKQLVDLYTQYKSKGLEIIGFPCNQFLGQEPGSNEQIKDFACGRYKAEFPLMDKVDVNGPNAAPIYTELLKKKFPGDIAWNFGKFLIGKDGHVFKRYEPRFEPKEIAADIEALLTA